MVKWVRSVIKELDGINIKVVDVKKAKSGHTKLFIKCRDGTKKFIIISTTNSDNRNIYKIKNQAKRTYNGLNY